MDTTSATPESIYRQRCARFGTQRDRYRRLSDRNGNLSLLIFGAAVVCFVFGVWRSQGIFYGAAGALVLALIASLVVHDRVRRRLRRYVELYAINEEGPRRIRREWAGLPRPAASRDRRETTATQAGRDITRQRPLSR